jgi:hypothetical protein
MNIRYFFLVGSFIIPTIIHPMQTIPLSELKTTVASTLPQLPHPPALMPTSTRFFADISSGCIGGMVFSEFIRYVQRKNKRPQNLSPYKSELALAIASSILITEGTLFLLQPTRTKFDLCCFLLGVGCSLLAGRNVGKKLDQGL